MDTVKRPRLLDRKGERCRRRRNSPCTCGRERKRRSRRSRLAATAASTHSNQEPGRQEQNANCSKTLALDPKRQT